MVDEQVNLDYPCPVCVRVVYYVSSIVPPNMWVCTSCQHTVSDRYMRKWERVKQEIIRSGRVVRVGMNIKDMRKEK